MLANTPFIVCVVGVCAKLHAPSKPQLKCYFLKNFLNVILDYQLIKV